MKHEHSLNGQVVLIIFRRLFVVESCCQVQPVEAL